MNSLKCHCLANLGGTMSSSKTTYLYLHFNNDRSKR
nr:MAG TPA: hypothetical protein [Caudoviricetes sp.]DAR96983.1 MAG TPA: hypothetical protein [Caudoviricetes sp.]